jgi:hypothetical protein
MRFGMPCARSRTVDRRGTSLATWPRAGLSRDARLIPTGSANSATLTTPKNTMYPKQWVALFARHETAAGLPAGSRVEPGSALWKILSGTRGARLRDSIAGNPRAP